MKFKSEKELAVLLITMVCFMALQTFFIIYLDRRIDNIAYAKSTYCNSEKHLFSNVEKTEKTVDCFEREEKACESKNKNEVIVIKKDALDRTDFWRYDFDKICRVLTAECGTDKELCFAVAQCLYNACEKQNWEYSLSEVLVLYKYADEVGWSSNEAQEACLDVFQHGNVCQEVKNATLFYAPQYCVSDWHEQQNFVCEINSVRFFEESQ